MPNKHFYFSEFQWNLKLNSQNAKKTANENSNTMHEMNLLISVFFQKICEIENERKKFIYKTETLLLREHFRFNREMKSNLIRKMEISLSKMNLILFFWCFIELRENVVRSTRIHFFFLFYVSRILTESIWQREVHTCEHRRNSDDMLQNGAKETEKMSSTNFWKNTKTAAAAERNWQATQVWINALLSANCIQLLSVLFLSFDGKLSVFFFRFRQMGVKVHGQMENSRKISEKDWHWICVCVNYRRLTIILHEECTH